MRIALYMDAPHIGGAERYFRDLCAGLADRGHDVHVICPNHVLVPYMRALGDAITLHTLGPRQVFKDCTAANVLRAVRPFRDIRACLRLIKPEMVHLCNGGYPAAHMCRAAVFSTSTPRVMTVNNRARERRRRFGRVEAELDQLTWKALSAVICPSRTTAERLQAVRNVSPEMVHVIPYGIGAPQPNLADVDRIRRRHAPNGELLVGIVAAPDPSGDHARHKGHDVLLEAIAHTHRSDIRLAVLGHDPGPNFAERAEQLGWSQRIDVLPGFRDVTPYMAAFDVLAVPSTRNEAMPLVVIEAMASGTPVLGSRLAGIPEVIIDNETGNIVPPGDVRELAARLQHYAADRTSVRVMGEQAQARYERGFSRDRMTTRTVAVYEHALGGGGQ